MLTEVLALSGLTGAVSAGIVIWLLRNWLLTRLRASIKHEYDEKLARFTGELQRISSAQAGIQSAFAQTHLVAQQKRLEAIGDVWRSFLQVRNNQPFLLGLVEMHRPTEYAELFAHEQMKKSAEDLSPQGVAKFARSKGSDTEIARPFVGEYLWSLMYAYEAVCIRTTLLLWQYRLRGVNHAWFEDEGTLRVIRSVTNDEEFQEFKSIEFGKISWFRNLIERKFLAAASRIINGEASTDIALQEGQRIFKVATELVQAKFPESESS